MELESPHTLTMLPCWGFSHCVENDETRTVNEMMRFCSTSGRFPPLPDYYPSFKRRNGGSRLSWAGEGLYRYLYRRAVLSDSGTGCSRTFASRTEVLLISSCLPWQIDRTACEPLNSHYQKSHWRGEPGTFPAGIETVLRLILVSMEQKQRFHVFHAFHAFHALHAMPCQKIQGQSESAMRRGFLPHRQPGKALRASWCKLGLARREPSTCSSLLEISGS